MPKTSMKKEAKTKETKSLLTYRKLEYLALAAWGLNNQEISDILYVTIFTVKATLEDIFRRLNAVDRTNAVFIACEHQLLTPIFCKQILEKYPILAEVHTSKILKRNSAGKTKQAVCMKN